MDITSPYVVVAAIVIAFAVSILFATSSKPDAPGHKEDIDENTHSSHV
jgi:hypothetical protein